MNTGRAPYRTAEGQDELATRARRLSQRHRTVLFLVDGRRSEADVRALAERAGAPASCVDDLLSMGLIARPVVPVTAPTQPAPLASRPMPLSAASRPAPLATPSQPMPLEGVDTQPSQHIDLPLDDDSLLPAMRTLQPDSSMNGELGPPVSWYPDEGDASAVDAPLEEARDLLLRAVRAEAPVAGSLTIMRLRRAHSREDLLALLGDVEQKIRRPQRELATTQLMQRVRGLLAAPSTEAR